MGKNLFVLFGGVLALVNVLCVPPAVADDGLLLKYSFDSDNGGVVIDQSGNGYNGTVQGNATYVSDGVVGGAYHFSGNPDAIRVGDLGTVSQGTISFWIKPDAVENWRNPFSTDYASWDDNIRFEEDSSGNLNVGALGLFAYNTDQTLTTQLSANQWQHIAFGWDDTTNYGYFNGNLVFTTPQPSADYQYPDLGNQTAGYFRNLTLQFHDVAIGNGYSTEDDRWWKGSVDEVNIFNRLLSSQEVGALAQVNTVPEPISSVLMLLGGGAMALRRRYQFSTKLTTSA